MAGRLINKEDVLNILDFRGRESGDEYILLTGDLRDVFTEEDGQPSGLVPVFYQYDPVFQVEAALLTADKLLEFQGLVGALESDPQRSQLFCRYGAIERDDLLQMRRGDVDKRIVVIE